MPVMSKTRIIIVEFDGPRTSEGRSVFVSITLPLNRGEWVTADYAAYSIIGHALKWLRDNLGIRATPRELKIKEPGA